MTLYDQTEPVEETRASSRFTFTSRTQPSSGHPSFGTFESSHRSRAEFKSVYPDSTSEEVPLRESAQRQSIGEEDDKSGIRMSGFDQEDNSPGPDWVEKNSVKSADVSSREQASSRRKRTWLHSSPRSNANHTTSRSFGESNSLLHDPPPGLPSVATFEDGLFQVDDGAVDETRTSENLSDNELPPPSDVATDIETELLDEELQEPAQEPFRPKLSAIREASLSLDDNESEREISGSTPHREASLHGGNGTVSTLANASSRRSRWLHSSPRRTLNHVEARIPRTSLTPSASQEGLPTVEAFEDELHGHADDYQSDTDISTQDDCPAPIDLPSDQSAVEEDTGEAVQTDRSELVKGSFVVERLHEQPYRGERSHSVAEGRDQHLNTPQTSIRLNSFSTGLSATPASKPKQGPATPLAAVLERIDARRARMSLNGGFSHADLSVLSSFNGEDDGEHSASTDKHLDIVFGRGGSQSPKQNTSTSRGNLKAVAGDESPLALRARSQGQVKTGQEQAMVRIESNQATGKAKQSPGQAQNPNMDFASRQQQAPDSARAPSITTDMSRKSEDAQTSRESMTIKEPLSNECNHENTGVSYQHDPVRTTETDARRDDMAASRDEVRLEENM